MAKKVREESFLITADHRDDAGMGDHASQSWSVQVDDGTRCVAVALEIDPKITPECTNVGVKAVAKALEGRGLRFKEIINDTGDVVSVALVTRRAIRS